MAFIAARLSHYRGSNIGKSAWQLLSTLAAFVSLWLLMLWSLDISYFLTLLLAIPTGGLIVRLFVLQHDCGHGSFFQSKQLNDWVGRSLGVLTLTPYQRWRKHHAVHHATSGNLDRRGFGDVLLMTVREYQAATPYQRLMYRIQRHPLMMFGIGAFGYFLIWQRFIYEPKTWHKERASVWWTNLSIFVVSVAIAWLIGLDRLLLVHLPVVAVASSLGVWLFYVQHQFEDTYYEHNEKWDYVAAGIEGCSYYQLPAVLSWLTANIGIHHIHHLDSRIPNYRLKDCFDENPEFQRVRRLTLWESIECASLRLWDEDLGVLVRYPKVARQSR